MKRLVRLIVPAVLAIALAAMVPASAIQTCYGEMPDLAFDGTYGNDVMYGTPGNDVIQTYGGDDVVYGNGGNDKICTMDGDDRVFGGAGWDQISGGAGRDVLRGGAGGDALDGDEGNDVLFPGPGTGGYADGGPGADRVVINAAGDNDVFGGLGVDMIDFRNAPTGIVVDLSFGHYDSIWAPPAIGSLVFEVEKVRGSAYDDTIIGDSLANRLFGMGGNDAVEGGGGNDTLDGGDGWDVLDGGPGADVCWNGEDLTACAP